MGGNAPEAFLFLQVKEELGAKRADREEVGDRSVGRSVVTVVVKCDRPVLHESAR